MKTSTSLTEHTFLEQKPYGTMERTLESQKSLLLTMAMILSGSLAFYKPGPPSGAQFCHLAGLE